MEIADLTERDSPSNVAIGNVNAGDEPGASSEHYLITTDIYDELNDLDMRLLDSAPGDACVRERTGTISELKKESRNIPVSNSAASFSSLEGASISSNNFSESELLSSQESDNKVTEDITKTIQRMGVERSKSSDADPELEFVQSREWKDKRKHIFVLSQSGKPIYSRYGSEEKLVTLFGVMQALVSFIHHGGDKDTLKCMVAGERKFVFSVRDNLILVAVTSMDECLMHTQLQLSYVHNQVLSVLTLTSLNKIFQQRVNYDLRRMLAGTEKFIDSLLATMETDCSYLLGSIRCLPLATSVRDSITQTMVQHCKIKDLVFALIISHNQLVALVRMKRFTLHPHDLHILLNLVQASDAFKAAESWLPICLPKFDSSGFLHAYISYMDEPCNSCLLLLSVNHDHFSALSECKQKIVERLNRLSCLQAIAESVAADGYSIDQVGVPEVRHFIYKSRSSAQFTCPEMKAPYVTDEQRQRLHSLYVNVHGRMHSALRPLLITYRVMQYESILGWVTSGFELYAVFSPLVTKQSAIASINKLLKWMKHEESRLFILVSTTF